MAVARKVKKVCPKGHTFYKGSDCPACPLCEAQKKPATGFLMQLSGPARRALENKGIKTLKQLARFKEAEILDLHGMGPASLPTLRTLLRSAGLHFKS
jgi:predicted RecB family nuclease